MENDFPDKQYEAVIEAFYEVMFMPRQVRASFLSSVKGALEEEIHILKELEDDD